MKTKKLAFTILFSLIDIHSKEEPKFINSQIINFESSMKNREKLIEYRKNRAFLSRLNLYKRLYNKNNMIEIKTQIPKKIHQIWLGGKKIPDKFMQIKKKWRLLHPDWEYKLWNDNNIKEIFPLKNQIYFNDSKNLGEKSDILRYEILYKFGGIYVDMDYECIKPFDILAKSYEFFVGIEPLNISPFYVGNAIIGSIAGHPILKHTIDTIKLYRNFKNVFDRTGPAHLTRCFCEFGNLKKIIALPVSYLYPMTCAEKLNKYKIDTYISPESFGIHYWSGTWK